MQNNLKELFGLKTAKYLKENCSIVMPINRKTRKNKSIAFMLSPEHIHYELLNLMALNSAGRVNS